MTEPRNMHRDRETEATTDDREPEVRPEVINDLDVPGDDADVIRAGYLSEACERTL
jgi:hypothetical protein